ncbi:glutamate dehydrogenase/leucine dehydrogenase [Moorella thermoacetica Y72]|uniref:Glutamate dehydrogenase/leucine dehydrogenase n=1 Tax=Moorella thermoacetica Y72 TaxID=1325331 RepID=A0A0S6UFH6_NEOTH|nr:glutamate dehydrogenase/leucine dehydrogenase [Moorella thermoacetica Y72]
MEKVEAVGGIEHRPLAGSPGQISPQKTGYRRMDMDEIKPAGFEKPI